MPFFFYKNHKCSHDEKHKIRSNLNKKKKCKECNAKIKAICCLCDKLVEDYEEERKKSYSLPKEKEILPPFLQTKRRNQFAIVTKIEETLFNLTNFPNIQFNKIHEQTNKTTEQLQFDNINLVQDTEDIFLDGPLSNNVSYDLLSDDFSDDFLREFNNENVVGPIIENPKKDSSKRDIAYFHLSCDEYQEGVVGGLDFETSMFTTDPDRWINGTVGVVSNDYRLWVIRKKIKKEELKKGVFVAFIGEVLIKVIDKDWKIGDELIYVGNGDTRVKRWRDYFKETLFTITVEKIVKKTSGDIIRIPCVRVPKKDPSNEKQDIQIKNALTSLFLIILIFTVFISQISQYFLNFERIKSYDDKHQKLHIINDKIETFLIVLGIKIIFTQ
eukprot:gene12457-6208_t